MNVFISHETVYCGWCARQEHLIRKNSFINIYIDVEQSSNKWTGLFWENHVKAASVTYFPGSFLIHDLSPGL